MPLGAYASLSGTVANNRATAADLTGTVLGGRGPNDLTGTVSRAAIESWDSPSIFARARVKLGDEFIPRAELVQLPNISEGDQDTHTAGWTFGLRGRRHGITQTERVFARTPVEIWLDHGPEGAVIEASAPDYSGYVIGCDQGGGQHEPMLVIQCGDEASKWEKVDACIEVAPGADLTRGEILELLFAEAGVPYGTIPRGAVYKKGFQATNKKVFEVVKPFIEPEGWRVRFNAAREAEIHVPAIKLAPLAPDFRWHKRDCLQPPKLVPPENSPSRWVLTANTVVDINEVGLVTETTTAEVESLYAPAVAVSQQQTDGSVTSTGFPSEPEAVRPVSRVVDTVIKQAGQPVMQRAVTSEWRNRRAARLVSNGSGAGAAGYNYLQVYIDDAGNYVQWWKEKFIVTGERVTTFTYNASGDLTDQVVDTTRWRLTEQGVRTVGTDPDATTILNSYVHGDGQSYFEQFEVWGLAEQQRLVNVFSDDGPLLYTRQDTYRYFNPRTKVEAGAPVSGWYVLYNGEAHNALAASWRRVESKTESNILGDDKSLKGTATATSGWHAREKKDGVNNFGTYRSNAEVQTFQLLTIENKAFNIVNEDQYEEITYGPNGGRVAKLYLGRLPTTRYKSSTWTRLLTQPIEVVVDDPLALAWFGEEKEVLQHEYCQDSAEAIRVIQGRRRRAMAPELTIVRPATMARKGDTVHFVSEEDGIDQRFIVVDRQPDWTSPMPVFTYVLEGWSG